MKRFCNIIAGLLGMVWLSVVELLGDEREEPTCAHDTWTAEVDALGKYRRCWQCGQHLGGL